MHPSFIRALGSARRLSLTAFAAGALLGASVVVSPAVAAAHGSTCSGTLGSRTYHSLTVTGFCQIPDHSSVVVKGGLTIAPGAALIGSSLLGGGCDRSVTVSGGVEVGHDAFLVLGDSAIGTNCAGARTVIRGGLHGDGADAIVIHGATIDGGMTTNGGGQPGCASETDLALCNFSALEDSQVNGGVSISGYGGFWLGFARNQVNGGVILRDNHLTDPDAMEILSNNIHGTLACSGNSPVPTNIPDQTVPMPNTVTGRETGQCAGL
jgi:hypothetical protein